jgi:outer membrane protein assembly factor BamE (lipoprotein component of BamABCDE complex)
MRYPLQIMACMILATACEPKVAARGHVDAQKRIEEIKPETHYKQDVLQKLGSPSTTSQFGRETWYYINSRKEAYGFMRPEVAEQKVTKISFDENGKVISVNRYGLEDRRDIALVEDATPTEGQELGFVEQILGNLGRFNQAPRQPAPY